MRGKSTDAAAWRPSAERAALQQRARLNQLIRQFFVDRGVLEVETPLLSAHGTTDRHIESFCVEAGAERRWLRTSPEFALKRLLAAGIGDCYELGRVFRRGEAGRRHNPEFSMLEWYRVGWDHWQLIEEVLSLMGELVAAWQRPWRVQRSSYRELFLQQLGLDPFTASDQQLLAALPTEVHAAETLQRDDWLDLLFSLRLQPDFAVDECRVVYHYPASQCALARVRGEGREAVAERFEVYLGTVEIANGYHELIDGDEQQRRFANDLAWRQQQARPGPPADAHLLAALQAGLPACAGVAMGIDRLLMWLLAADDLSALIVFPYPRA